MCTTCLLYPICMYSICNSCILLCPNCLFSICILSFFVKEQREWQPRTRKLKFRRKKPWSTIIGRKGKMFGGVWANKQWLPISLVQWGFEYFLHGIINGIYTGRALFRTVFFPNLITPQPHSERRIYKIREKLENIHASIPFNSVCWKCSGLISGVMPKLWQSKPFGVRKFLVCPFSVSCQWSHLISKNASNYPKCHTLRSFNLWCHTEVVC